MAVAIGCRGTPPSYGPAGRGGWGPGAAPWPGLLFILRERWGQRDGGDGITALSGIGVGGDGITALPAHR